MIEFAGEPSNRRQKRTGESPYQGPARYESYRQHLRDEHAQAKRAMGLAEQAHGRRSVLYLEQLEKLCSIEAEAGRLNVNLEGE